VKVRLERLFELERMEEDGSINVFKKKEISALRREKRRILRNLDGVRKMDQLPGALVIVDPNREKTAVLEANRLGIPVVAFLDTDCDPDAIDIPIPGNDDAMRSIEVVLDYLAQAVGQGRKSWLEQKAAEEKAQREREERERREREMIEAARKKRAAEQAAEQAGGAASDAPAAPPSPLKTPASSVETPAAPAPAPETAPAPSPEPPSAPETAPAPATDPAVTFEPTPEPKPEGAVEAPAEAAEKKPSPDAPTGEEKPAS
jgi:small subunit ribosomal protein S2